MVANSVLIPKRGFHTTGACTKNQWNHAVNTEVLTPSFYWIGIYTPGIGKIFPIGKGRAILE